MDDRVTRLDRLKRITKQNKFRLFACALSGIVSSIPYYFPSFFFLSWFSYILCFYFILHHARSPKQAYLYLFSSELARSIMTLLWFRELLNMTVFDMPKIFLDIVVAVAIFGIAFFQSAIISLCAPLIKSAFTYCKSDILASICSAIFYTMAEFILGIGPLGFPWSAIYISQQKFLPAIQSASLFGGHFVSFVVILINICLAVFIKKHAENSKAKGICILAAAVFILNMLFGVYELCDISDSTREIKVAAIQDNTSSYDKWGGNTYDILKKVKSELKKTEYCDLILCSETVFPITLDTDVVKASSLAKEIELYLSDITYKNKNVIIVGAFSEKENKNYNSLFLFDNGNIYPDTYDKKNIVPFVEYLPMEDFILDIFPFVDNLNLSGNSITAGTKSKVFTSSVGKIGCMICFDSIFYDNATESVGNGANILALSTNDSWYNDSAATVQFLGHAVFRAIENKRYLVRSATTGYSAIITEDGIITNKSELLTQDSISGNVKLSEKITLFNKCGYTPLLLSCLTALMFLIICAFEHFKIYHNPKSCQESL